MGNHPDKCVVTVALTGVAANRAQCPAIPYTPVEIAEEATRCYEAGASVAHIHARTDEGMPSFSKDVYAEIIKECRDRSPIIINFSTGAIGVPMEDRVAHIRDLAPEIGALNMGSMTYAKYSKRTKTFIFDMVFQNPFSDIIFLIEQMKIGNVKPELECFDMGHIGNIAPLIDMGKLIHPLQISLVMGVLGGIPPTTENLVAMKNTLPDNCTWELIGISRVQWKLVMAALTLEGNIRVGLEDNFYLPNGEMASSNADLVEKAVQMTRDTGREPATVEEARTILGLDDPWGFGVPAGTKPPEEALSSN